MRAGPLEPILADPEVTEVMVNGPGRVWVERAGRLERVPVALDTPAIEHLIEKVVAPLGLRVDRSSPLVDARLPDGSRVNAIVPPLAVDGPCLTVRRFGARAIPLAAFAAPSVVALLAWAVAARLNVLVSGGTGAGKTTLLNALAGCIPPGERVVTVEDAAELRLPGEHVVRLEARPANAEGAGEVRIRELVRNALRMRPDRIVVGEVRGPEALDMLQAMNSGHEGSLSTCHANSPDDALRRLETMVLMGDVGLPLAAVPGPAGSRPRPGGAGCPPDRRLAAGGGGGRGGRPDRLGRVRRRRAATYPTGRRSRRRDRPAHSCGAARGVPAPGSGMGRRGPAMTGLGGRSIGHSLGHPSQRMDR